tara:strand:- start:225 stop:905 length:681 start_codon:yes stop_codon:yes gene_type:complete
MAIPDSDLTELQKENLKLQNQQLRYEIQKNNLNESDVIYPIKLANENPKVITRRSNFYKTLNNNQEVKKVGFSKFNKNNEKDKSEMIIKRPSFINFIQRSNKLPVEIDENAVIEIVAPVLREGGSKWKGIYLDEPIGFVISDIVYKTSVLNKEISFTSGNSIKCVLEIHKELNEVGEEIVKKYNVQTVLETIKSGSSQETPSGKRYKKVKAINGVQNDFFAQLDEE